MVSEYEGNGRAEESEGLVEAVLEHKGYAAGRAEFDEEAGLFHGEVAGLRDVVTTFQGTDVGELEEAFWDSVADSTWSPAPSAARTRRSRFRAGSGGGDR